jgi:hypothetical protein
MQTLGDYSARYPLANCCMNECKAFKIVDIEVYTDDISLVTSISQVG